MPRSNATDVLLPDPREMNIEDKVMDLQGKWRCPKCNRYIVKNGFRNHVRNCDGKPKPAGGRELKDGRKSRAKMNKCPFCGLEFFGRAILGHRLTCIQNPKRLEYMANLTQWNGLTREEFIKKFGAPPPPPAPNPPKVEIKTADGTKFIFDAEDSL